MLVPPHPLTLLGACAIRQCAGERKVPLDESEADSDQDIEEEDPDLSQSLPTADFDDPQPQAQARTLQQSVTKLERKVRSLKTVVQWLKVEKRQLVKGVGRGRAAFRRRCKELRKRVKGLKFTKSRLSALYEKYKGLLKVRESQLRRKALLLRRKVLHDKVQDKGPKALEKGDQSRAMAFSQAEVRGLSVFWRSVWEAEGKYNPSHEAIQQWKRATRLKLQACTEDLTPVPTNTAWEESWRKMASWKAPGPDQLYAYWYKTFQRLAGELHDLLFAVLADPTQELPGWFVRGRTVLVPKSPKARAPEKQRPITCLNTGYKLLTGTLTVILRSHVMRLDLLPLEQKALRKGARGCLDALAIDTAVLEEVKRERRDLAVAWVDFRKAYDQVPHQWINKCLKVLKAPKVVRRTVRRLRSVADRHRGKRAQGQDSIACLFQEGVIPRGFAVSLALLSGHQSHLHTAP